MHELACEGEVAPLVDERGERTGNGCECIVVGDGLGESAGGDRVLGKVLACDERMKRKKRRTGRFHRSKGVAPISFATVAQVNGPTYALTAAFSTRVGKCGYDACRYSDANRPRSELPTVLKFALDRKTGSLWLCSAKKGGYDACVHACRISSGSCTTRARPIRCAKAERVEAGGFWRAAHTSGEKFTGFAALKIASFGGNWRRVETGVEAICAAFDAIRNACAMDLRRRVHRARARLKTSTSKIPAP